MALLVRALISIVLALGAGCGRHRPHAIETHSIDNRASSPGCPARIDTTPVDGTVFPTWLAAWTELAGAAASTTTDDQARARLCTNVNGCSGDGPRIISTGDRYHLVAPVADGLLLFTDLGVAVTTPCHVAPYLEIVAGDPLRVEVTDVILDDHADGTSACVSAGAGYTDVFFDLATRQRILSIDRDRVTNDPSIVRPGTDDWHDPVSVTVVPGGVRILGAGCDRTIPFPQ